MALATIDNVKEIIETSLTDTNISVYINAMSTLLDSIWEGYTVSDDIRTVVEAWGAAHLIAVSKERQGLTEKAGTASITYTGEYSTAFSMTSYGQMALTFDPTGELATSHLKGASITAVKSFKRPWRRIQ